MTRTLAEDQALRDAADWARRRYPLCDVTLEVHRDHTERSVAVRVQRPYSALWGFGMVLWIDAHTRRTFATEPRTPPDGHWHGRFARQPA